MTKAYWIERCKAAENFIEESPCDPDVTYDQIVAWEDWDFLKKQEK